MRLLRRVYQERRRVMLPLIALLIANAAALGLAVYPLSRHVSGLETAADNASTNLLRARLVETQAKDASASKVRADQELKKFYIDILPANDRAAQRVMSFLQRAAAESGLQFDNTTLEYSEVRDSQLLRLSGKVVLSGEYQNIRKFLYHVETAEEFVIVERVGLTQAADLRSANTGRLEIALEVATYYIATPAAATPR
jgi:Tfp pilus assembly protein PilO